MSSLSYYVSSDLDCLDSMAVPSVSTRPLSVELEAEEGAVASVGDAAATTLAVEVDTEVEAMVVEAGAMVSIDDPSQQQDLMNPGGGGGYDRQGGGGGYDRQGGGGGMLHFRIFLLRSVNSDRLWRWPILWRWRRLQPGWRRRRPLVVPHRSILHNARPPKQCQRPKRYQMSGERRNSSATTGHSGGLTIFGTFLISSKAAHSTQGPDQSYLTWNV